ncbi:uncharacterized protein LOC120945788 isoform X2 [Rana temporaria]|uniref:uncharacterized protein LOC120945788 isoform X2 n=1 Tax=Rana temporaria TaxID=8407 RepID=UPI001AACA54A|nr:uncharacterized protein LOC120945788 isoform X2 [Rana temporaria]
MKVIPLFALLGLSFYQASGKPKGLTTPVSNADDSCLPNTLKKDKKQKMFQDAAKGLILGMKRSLQLYKKGTTGTGESSESIEKRSFSAYKKGKTGTDESAESIVRSFLLSGDSPRDLCAMVENLITPLCLNGAHGKLPQDVVTDLGDLHTMLNNTKKTEAASKVTHVLRKIKCTDTVDLDIIKILTNVLGSLGNVISPFVEEVVNIVKVRDEDCNIINSLLVVHIG